MADLRDSDGERIVFPATADGWAEPQWIAYWCHTDVPWLTQRLRDRIRDFTTVLGCRFPTITDIRSPYWGKSALRTLASWRYRFQRTIVLGNSTSRSDSSVCGIPGFRAFDRAGP